MRRLRCWWSGHSWECRAFCSDRWGGASYLRCGRCCRIDVRRWITAEGVNRAVKEQFMPALRMQLNEALPIMGKVK